MVQEERCFSTGRDLPNRLSEVDFERLQITVRNLNTVVSLLKCDEPEVVISALTSLSKFVEKSVENARVIFEHRILDDLLPLVEHEDLSIRRSAAKLLGQMTDLEAARNFLLNSEGTDCLHCLMKIVHRNEDLFVHENLLKALCNCSGDVFGAFRISESPHLKVLFSSLRLTNANVRRCALETLNNMTLNPLAIDRIFSLEDFSFALLLELLDDSSEVRSLSLSLLENFLMRQDDEVHREFREADGLQKLLELFYSDGFESQSFVLDLLVLATENLKTAEHFASIVDVDEIAEFIRAIEYSPDPANFQLVANLSAVPGFRKSLFDLGIVRLLLENLRRDWNIVEVLHPIGSIIANVCHFSSAAAALTEADVVLLLLEFLQNEEIGWNQKESLLFAIRELLSRDSRNRQKLVETSGHVFLIKIAQNDSVFLNTRLECLQVIKGLLKFPKFRRFFAQCSIIDDLSTLLNDEVVDELKMASCSILSQLFVEAEARNLCQTNFVKKLLPLIDKKQSIPVRSCAIQLMQQLSYDERLIDEFVEVGVLDALLENRRVMRHVLPSWETCVEAILSGHLPLKFAVTGRLSLRDTTKNGFYVQQSQLCPLPSLDQLFKSRCSPMQCLYVANFSNSVVSSSSECGLANSLHSLEAYESDSQSCVPVNPSFGEKFSRLSPDLRLCEYLEVFRRTLVANESADTFLVDSPNVTDVSKIESRAKLLAKFVAQVLSGAAASTNDHCIHHQVQIHLHELRESLETSIIPLGKLRVGSYLERAVLFKVIADRICLPAALVRGEYGKSWIEVCLPQLHTSPSKNSLPTKLLKPNYIVDLMDNPGDFIPLNGNRARKFFEFEPLCCKESTKRH